MKITNSDSIKNREKELLEMISGDLDRDSIRKMLAAKYHLDLDGDRLTCRGGDLVVHDNQVAYKVEYDAVVSLSLLFNRQGECLEIVPSAEGGFADKAAGIQKSVADAGASAEDATDEVDAPAERGGYEADSGGDRPSARMASTIADMIAEINKP